MLLIRETQLYFLMKWPREFPGLFCGAPAWFPSAKKCRPPVLNRVFLTANGLYPRLGLLDSLEEPVYNRDFDGLRRGGFRKLAGSYRPHRVDE